MARINTESNSRGKVFVCDDDQGIIDSLKIVLGRMDIQVEGTTKQREAIDILKKKKYDILVLDYLMEGMNGDELLEVVRDFSNIYTIMLTGHVDIIPPIETIRRLSIQGYCEKSNLFDEITKQVEIGLKCIKYAKSFIFHVNFTEILQILRQEAGYSQEDVAKSLGVNRGTIIDYESGASYPSYVNLIKLANLFKVSVDFLLGRIIQK